MQKSTSFFILLFISTLLYGQSQQELGGTMLNESLAAVSHMMKQHSKSQKLYEPEGIRFPLASKKESHLVCSEVRTQYGSIDRVVFTFADDALSYIEARGNVSETLLAHRKDTAQRYMEYHFYPSDKLIVNPKEDAAWIMTDAAMHVNLFTWNNPYLNGKTTSKETAEVVTEIPAFLKMGGDLAELLPMFEENSAFTNREELDGSDPFAQVQINCFGVDYMGFPRKVEARFGKDKLNVVWILTAKAEEARIHTALVEQFGDPIFTNDAWEIYNDWQVALRKDKPEVLLMEKEVGQFYKANFFKQ